ncbi:MAG: TonB-dependent receptor [Colwellia sp.]|nr:TonB-dependent receptor [Colwellia sp.]
MMKKINSLLNQISKITLCLIAFSSINTPLFAKVLSEDYFDLDLEDLLAVEVTSVAKKKQKLNEVAAAVFVITQKDIQRSGVTSIPEALRMAPGIQVAKMDANKWAITSRGFNSQITNKLLVLIDGRTVYTTSYSGVYWDVQDTLLDDIDRIEVIRGPGASIWGANAVNGVINIITKNAEDTQGGLVVAGVGNEEKSFISLRYGDMLNEGTAARVYLKYNQRDNSYSSELNNGHDKWKSLRSGFRIDSQLSDKDSLTVQADIYDNDENQAVNLWLDPSDPTNAPYAPYYRISNMPSTIKSNGWNLLSRWQQQLSDQSSTTLQVYFDHKNRSEAFVDQKHDTFDVDFQHRFQATQSHEINWGLGYRHIKDNFKNSYNVSVFPDNDKRAVYSAFVQDEVELLPNNLKLTLGIKFEHNDYTGKEIQPSSRLAWLINDRNTLWGSFSYAVRTPSRIERTGQAVGYVVPLPPTYTSTANAIEILTRGNKDFKSEELTAIELGYRFKLKENVSFDLSLFHNDYDNLQSFENFTDHPLSSSQFTNNLSAKSYGLELATEWRPLEWWRLQSSYSYITVTSRYDTGFSSSVPTDLVAEGSSPKHQLSVRSIMDLSHNVSFDVWTYYVDRLKRTSMSYDIVTPSYTSANIKLAWLPSDNLELSLVGQNLLDSHHPEFIAENFQIPTEVERSIYAKIKLSF